MNLFIFDNTLKVLWIGNSYTYGNDLPKMVEQLAANDGKTMRYDQHTNGGWTWGKHAASAVAFENISFLILKMINIFLLITKMFTKLIISDNNKQDQK